MVRSMLSCRASCSGSCFSLKMLLPTCPLDSPRQLLPGWAGISPSWIRPTLTTDSIHHLWTCSLTDWLTLLVSLPLQCKFHEREDLCLFCVPMCPNFQIRAKRTGVSCKPLCDVECFSRALATGQFSQSPSLCGWLELGPTLPKDRSTERFVGGW